MNSFNENLTFLFKMFAGMAVYVKLDWVGVYMRWDQNGSESQICTLHLMLLGLFNSKRMR
jgi:hypothetical protein